MSQPLSQAAVRIYAYSTSLGTFIVDENSDDKGEESLWIMITCFWKDMAL